MEPVTIGRRAEQLLADRRHLTQQLGSLGDGGVVGGIVLNNARKEACLAFCIIIGCHWFRMILCCSSDRSPTLANVALDLGIGFSPKRPRARRRHPGCNEIRQGLCGLILPVCLEFLALQWRPEFAPFEVGPMALLTVMGIGIVAWGGRRH